MKAMKNNSRESNDLKLKISKEAESMIFNLFKKNIYINPNDIKDSLNEFYLKNHLPFHQN